MALIFQECLMASKRKTSQQLSEVVQLDPVWELVRKEAQAVIDDDPAMSGFIYGTILNQRSLEDAVIQRIL